MSLLKDFITLGLTQMEDYLESPTLTWKGDEYTVINSSWGKDLTLEEGGFGIEADISFTIRKDQFGDAFPSSHELVIFNETTYRITTVKHDASGVFLRLLCVNSNKGI